MFNDYFITAISLTLLALLLDCFDFILDPIRLLGSMIKKACKKACKIVAEPWDEAKKNYK